MAFGRRKLSSATHFGDAPDTPYPTTLKNNGARHGINEGLRLGARIDAELDGQPSPDALDDDITPTVTSDDEDGVVFPPRSCPAETANVVVTVFGQGLASAWVRDLTSMAVGPITANRFSRTFR